MVDQGQNLGRIKIGWSVGQPLPRWIYRSILLLVLPLTYFIQLWGIFQDLPADGSADLLKGCCRICTSETLSSVHVKKTIWFKDITCVTANLSALTEWSQVSSFACRPTIDNCATKGGRQVHPPASWNKIQDYLAWKPCHIELRLDCLRLIHHSYIIWDAISCCDIFIHIFMVHFFQLLWDLKGWHLLRLVKSDVQQPADTGQGCLDRFPSQTPLYDIIW